VRACRPPALALERPHDPARPDTSGSLTLTIARLWPGPAATRGMPAHALGATAPHAHSLADDGTACARRGTLKQAAPARMASGSPGKSGGAAAARLLDGARAVEQVRGADLHAGRQLHLRWRALRRHKHLPRRAQIWSVIE